MNGLHVNYKNGDLLHMDNQWMKTYVLNTYVIHVKCVDIMVIHHLQLNIDYDITYIYNYYIFSY
jgi:hypothetical protein